MYAGSADISAFEQTIREIEIFCREGAQYQNDIENNLNLYRIDRAIYRNLENVTQAARADQANEELLCPRQINCRTTMLNALVAFIHTPSASTQQKFDAVLNDFENDLYAKGSLMSPHLKKLATKFAIMFATLAIAGGMISGIVIGNLKLANDYNGKNKEFKQLVVGLGSAMGISLILLSIGIVHEDMIQVAYNNRGARLNEHYNAQIPAYKKTQSQRALLNAVKKFDVSFSKSLAKHGLLAAKTTVIEVRSAYLGDSNNTPSRIYQIKPSA